MKKAILEQMLYDCQIGMYFDGVKRLSNGFVVYSNFIKDENWNFIAGVQAKSVKEFDHLIKQGGDFLAGQGKKMCFSLSPLASISLAVRKHIEKNFQKVDEDVFLLCKKIAKVRPLGEDYTFKKIDNSRQRELFVQTFRGSKQQTLPGDTYKPLGEEYFQALDHSFDKRGQWQFVHYLSLFKEKPVGMVSLCKKGEFCGIFGAGTYVKHRGKGVFSNLFKFIYDEQTKLGVKYFFCTTKANSYNHKFYNKLGFKDCFLLERWMEKKRGKDGE